MDTHDFVEQVGFERTLLAEGVPAAALVAGSTTYVYHAGGGQSRFHIGGHSAGEEAVARFRRRLVVLFFLAAWKVLDAAVEFALARAGLTERMTIRRKIKEVGARADAMPELPQALWSALVVLYANTEQVRHSLVHRRVQSVNHAIVGVDEEQTPLRPVSHEEQAAFCELIQRTADAIERGQMTLREEKQCLHLLWRLRELHRIAELPELPKSVIVKVEYVVDTQRVVPVSAIKRHMDGAHPGWTGIDLVVIDNATASTLAGEMEDVVEHAVVLDRERPPSWLRPQLLPARRPRD